MLFTGLLGAWLSAVFLIPKVSELGHKYKFFTFPQIFGHFYNGSGALAGIISAIGYIGFTSSQVLAGAKLASATIDGLNIQTALIVMGVIAGLYFHWRIKSSNLYRYYPMVNSYRWLSIYRNTSCL
jgi:SSS family solute:Na+ symporter